MNKELFQKTIKQVKETSPKRKFTQTIDLIINLKILNLKNPNENLDLFVTLPNPLKRKHKICAIVDKELASASKFFDKTIQQEELAGLRKNPKEIKKLSRQYDWFIAQANLMAEVATVFGKILGPRGKMPNPKAGCVITPTSNLEQVKEKLDKTVQVKTKKELIVKIPVGKEDQDDSKILENIIHTYNNIIHSLPQEEANVRSVYLKLTMGPSLKVGSKKEEIKEDAKEQPKNK